MGHLSVYVTIFIAVVLVAIKLILEHQYEVDKVNGVEGRRDEYTFRGMLKTMRAERREKRLRRRAAGVVPRNPSSPGRTLRVQGFESSSEGVKENGQ